MIDATSMMSPTSSVTVWIANLKAGQASAAHQLWNRYADRLVDLARRKLGAAPKAVADEEDIAQSVFGSICRGAAAGRFDRLNNRDDLWWILLAVTRRKAVDHIRREASLKRGGGRVRSESGLNRAAFAEGPFALDQLIGCEPTAELLAILEEQHRRLLGMLRDDDLRKIAMLRIEGYTVAEVADMLGISVRSIERKLRLIRNAWSHELAHVA
jgi:RNA polymerase sigma factor (sigma-70 family)